MSPRPPLLDRAHLRRRATLAASRGWRSLSGGLRRPCVFLHLPKCGGTSLTAALAGCVPLTQRIGMIDALATRRAAGMLQDGRDSLLTCHEDLDHGARTFALREAQLLTYMAQGHRLICGHVFCSPRAFDTVGRDYALVTVMRDPVERALSNYRMAVRAGVIADDIDAWLDAPVGRRMAQSALRYLAGEHTVHDEAAALDRARMALDRMALVGVLEDLPGFTRAFDRVFGVRPLVPRLNPGTGPAVRLNDRQMTRLLGLTAPDRALYAMARALATQAAETATGLSPAPKEAVLQKV